MAVLPQSASNKPVFPVGFFDAIEMSRGDPNNSARVRLREVVAISDACLRNKTFFVLLREQSY